MSPLPVAAAAAGTIKGATAKQMATFAKAMNKTDWDGVNNAMQSIKDFGASASLVQETLGDIKSMAETLVDIALGTWLSNLVTKFGLLFDKLEPLATAFDVLNASISESNKQIHMIPIDEMNEGMLDVRKAWHDFWVSMGMEADAALTELTESVGGREGARRGAIRKITELEGGY